VGPNPLEPGRTSFARLHIDGEPLAALPGDRFVVRGFARTAMGGTTLGGGVVLDVAPAHRRRSDPLLLRELEILAGEDLPNALGVRIARSGLAGAAPKSLQQETGLTARDLASVLDALERSGRAIATSSGTWLTVESVEALESRLGDALDAFHRTQPLQRGMPTGALRGALPGNVPPEVADLALTRLAERGALAVHEDRVQRPDHEPVLGAAQQQLAERILAATQAAGLDPPSGRDLAEKLGAELEPLRELQAHLEREGLLVGAPGGLCFERGAVDALRERVVAWLREHGRLETQDYKALIGTSRRSAVPLMELFDAEHLTMRRGEARVLRSKT
jgi:selenocysteine-specific elongation factor